jgi:hypothetical protein
VEGAKEIMDAIGVLKSDLDQRHGENITAQAVTDAKVVELLRGVDDLRRAFPDGDWDGHRRYHEAIIKKLEAREQFYRELRGELAKKGLWALLVMLGLAVWAYFKAKVTS